MLAREWQRLVPEGSARGLPLRLCSFNVLADGLAQHGTEVARFQVLSVPL